MAKIKVTNPQQIINGGAKKYYFKVKGLGGPKGDRGEKGDTGSRGPQGEPGNAATVYVGSTTTLPVGQDATVENVGTQYNAVLNFGIPQGPRGPQGIQGERGEPGQTGQTGPRGPQGERGTNATVYIGTTTTLNPGTQATVYNSGTENNAVLNFGIPRGEKGETGSTGATGATGPAGQNFTPTIVDSLPATGNQSNLYLTPKNYTTGTATGNPITISLGEEAGQISSAQLDGDTTQQTYTGQNLLPYPYQGDINQAGITFTENADRSISISGKNNGSSNSAYYLYRNANNPLVLPAGTYYFIPPSVAGDITITGYTGSSYIDFESGNNFSKTFSSETSFRNIYIQVRKTDQTQYDNVVIYPMLTTQANPTVADYEPYVGGVPAPNPDYPQAVNTVTGTQTVEVVGKNLFDIGSSLDNDYFLTSSNGLNVTSDVVSSRITGSISNNTITISNYDTTGWRWLSKWVKLEKNTDYELQAVRGPSGVKIVGFSSNQSGAAGTQVAVVAANTTTPKSFNSGDYEYYAISIYPVGSGQQVSNIQVELGSTATAYTPYSKQTLPIDLGSIELCKIGTYQDYIYKDGDDWKIHKATAKIVLNGSENIELNTSSTNTTRVAMWNILTPSQSTFQPDVMLPLSDHFMSSFIWNEDKEGLYCQIRSIVFRANKSTIGTTEQSVKSWLVSNNVSVYYALATATDATITDQTLIAQLEAVRNATLEASNTITNTATGTNLAGDLELGYYEYDPHNRYNKWLWLDINNNYEQLGS